MERRRSGRRPISTSPNVINTFSNIEQVRVVDIFRPTSMYYTIPPNTLSLVGRAAGLEPISKLPINANSIYWKSQKSTMFTLVMGEMEADMRDIFIYPFNINSHFLIARVIADVLLWPISTSINISSVNNIGRVAGQTWPTSMTSAIIWGRLAGLLRPMSTTFAASTINLGRMAGIKRPMSTNFPSQRHVNTFLFITSITVIKIMVRRMYGLKKPRS